MTARGDDGDDEDDDSDSDEDDDSNEDDDKEDGDDDYAAEREAHGNEAITIWISNL